MGRVVSNVVAGEGRRSPRPAGIVFLVGVALIFGRPDGADTPKKTADAEIRAILADMAAQGTQFRPEKLHALGLSGLSAVLDWLLPETAAPKEPPVSDEAVAELIAQLGDASFGVREAATEKFDRLGSSVRAPLREAAHSTDAEIRWRATRILRRWQSERTADRSGYVDAFAAYAALVNDEERVAELARRCRLVFDDHMPDGAKQSIVRHCLLAVARSGKDQYVYVLKPLLGHDDVRVAVFVTEVMGSGAGGPYYPGLLLDAIQAGRTDIVTTALQARANCANSPRAAEVKEALVAIFQREDEPLKFLSCAPLMRGFQYPQAVDYLLSQAAGDDLGRKMRAIAILGDSCNEGKAASPKLLQTLGPLLNSDDYNLRRATCSTLAIYSGEEVIKSLVPLLADRVSIVRQEVSRRLLAQPDKQTLRRVLTAAAESDDSDEQVRAQAEALLEKLELQQ